jgi:hypothetical protein
MEEGAAQSSRKRPFGVTVIALYEFFLIGLIVCGVSAMFAAHFARGPAASGEDPLAEYFGELSVFVPTALVFHTVAGVGLWLLHPGGRVFRLSITSLNVIAYMQWRDFFIIEYLPPRFPGVSWVYFILTLDVLIFGYLWFYPGVKESFRRGNSLPLSWLSTESSEKP